MHVFSFEFELSLFLLRSWLFFACEFWLSKGERYVSVPDHMLYLTFHRNAEEGNEIHYKDGPEDWNIEELEKRTAECDHCGFRC